MIKSQKYRLEASATWLNGNFQIRHILITVCRILQKTLHWSGPIDDATDESLPHWWCDPAWPTPFSVAVFVHPDPYQWFVFYTPSLAVSATRCDQLYSNMSNF